MLSSGWLLPSGDSLDGAAEDISSAVGISAAKAENGMAPRQSMTAKIRASVLFKVFCIAFSFLCKKCGFLS